MPTSAARRGGLAAASVVALSTGSVALSAAGATAEGGSADGAAFLLVFVGLLVLAVLPICAVTAAASAASNNARALAHAILAGGVYGAGCGLAVRLVVGSATCAFSLGAFSLGGALSGALLAPSVVAMWAPSILAAISGRRLPTHDSADVVQAITAGWAAVLLGAFLLAVLALGGLTPWLLPIVAAALVDLAWWRASRARILYRGSGGEGADWLGRVTADDASDREARPMVRNFVIARVRWFEVAVLVALVIGSASALIGWVWAGLLSDASLRRCIGGR